MFDVRYLLRLAAPAVLCICVAVPAFAQANRSPTTPAPIALIPGAWASGDSPDACRTAPISYFLSDGTYVVFDRFDGPLHAVGRWRIEGAIVILTHTDAPFPENGVASAEAALNLRRLDSAVFETSNAAGRVRVRTRCVGLVLPPGATAGSH